MGFVWKTLSYLLCQRGSKVHHTNGQSMYRNVLFLNYAQIAINTNVSETSKVGDISVFFWLPQEYSDKMAAVLVGVNILHQPPCVFAKFMRHVRLVVVISGRRDNCFKLITDF